MILVVDVINQCTCIYAVGLVKASFKIKWSKVALWSNLQKVNLTNGKVDVDVTSMLLSVSSTF